MSYKIKTLFNVLLFSFTSLFAQEVSFTGILINPPVATRQLGPAIFFSQNILYNFVEKEGNIVLVSSSDKTMELRVYMSHGNDSTFGFYREYADYFNFEYGKKYNLKIKKVNQSKTKLKPKPVKFMVENYPGNLDKWKGYAFGAPHGDCDFETGAIVQLVAENYGIPATAAYGCRLSYRGIWYDCNRPLMKEANPTGDGVISERLWNEKAWEKYSAYQDSVWANSKLTYGKRFKLFTSFHGHDLTVKLPSGVTIQRPVIEGIGVGFTKNELRRIKKFYYDNRNKYFENPPGLYFGNLPEDLIYEYQGIKLKFFYSGLGTRTYGSLRNDITEYALHFETPNSIRISPEVQPKTAQMLNDIYIFIKDSVFTNPDKKNSIQTKYLPPTNLDAKIELQGGTFLFGAPDNFGWSSERPQNKVFLSPFAINIYEVTNKQYCNFLNDSFNDHRIEVIDGVVVCKEDNNKVLFKTKTAAPFSEIEFANNKFTVIKGRYYFPVVFVSYYGADKYSIYKGERLPTEAEWEFAASWDGENKYLYGTTSDKAEESLANYEDSADPFEIQEFIKTTPVGFYNSASPSGCKDMSGNVWEWCSDFYQYNIHAVYKDNIVKNPTGPELTTMKVIKGGAWNTEGSVISTTKRLGINPNTTLINLGFRCAKTIK